MTRLRQIFVRKQMYEDLSTEMHEHLAERAQELIAGGMSEEEARLSALREFGNVALQEERGREAWQWSALDSLLRDVRFAARQLRRSPGFSLTVIVTLALAVGANTAVFSLVSALLLRPLPYPHPERLRAVTWHVDGEYRGRHITDDEDGQDGEAWELIQKNVPAIIPAALSQGSNGINLQARGRIQYVRDHRVSAAYFDVLGIKPLIGRTFTNDEDRPRGPSAVILSFELWKSIFASDPGVVGQAIRLKGVPYTVVGVMPPNLHEIAQADLWTPLQPSRSGEGVGTNYYVIMRLREGSTWAEVNGQLQALRPQLLLRILKHLNGGAGRLDAVPLQQDLAQQSRTPALVLMWSVGLILLIACANIAGLMLVRTGRRSGEFRTRMALGASRSAILRQAIMEPVLLGLVGGVAGIVLAAAGLDAFSSLLPAELLPVSAIRVDAQVLAFSLLALLVSALLISVFPVFGLRRLTLTSSAARSGTESSARSARTRSGLIAVEVCLTVALLASAGLLIRTLVYLETLPPGFDGTNVMSARASLDDPRYHDPAAFQKLLQRSVEAMDKIPGVESAAVGLSLPFQRGLNDGFEVADGPTKGVKAASSAAYVTPGYFDVLRIPLLAGRNFTSDDTQDSAAVTIVNAAFAKKYMGSLDVIGRHINGKTTATIVGLVGNVTKPPGIEAHAPLSSEPMYYTPATQVDGNSLALIHLWFQPSWIVRTRGPIAGLTAAMQKALAEAAPDLPFSGFYSLSDLQTSALSQQRVEVLLLTSLAGLGLLLSLIGIYGLVSNMVVQRTREIGIRMALGATLSTAMAAVAKSGIVALGYGMAAGIVLCAFSLRIIKTQIFGVRTYDPLTLLGVLVFLAVAGLVASFLPSLRIARIDPSSTLRAE